MHSSSYELLWNLMVEKNKLANSVLFGGVLPKAIPVPKP